MPTINTNITSAWTKVADSSVSALLITWSAPVPLEIALTATDVAPTVVGHQVDNASAITRDVIGAGFVWMRSSGSAIPAAVTLVITK